MVLTEAIKTVAFTYIQGHLAFEHPVKNEAVSFTAAPPKDSIWDACI